MDIAENKSLWFASLSPELRQKIRFLHHPIAKWNLIAILIFLSIWIITGWAIMVLPYWPIQLIGYIIIGSILHSLAILAHECVHSNMFRRARLDRIVGFLLGVPALFCFSAYQVTHLLHHKYTRTDKDPDEFTNLSVNRKWISLGFYLWPFVGSLIYLFHIFLTSMLRGTASERKRVLMEEACLILIITSIITISYQLGYFNVVLQCWLFPLIFTVLFANLRAWSEHTMTSRENEFSKSRVIISNRLFSFLLCNQNYHLEHHLFPAMPWYQLSVLHRLLISEYRKANIFIYNSYLKFIWDAVRNGIHSELPSFDDRKQYWISN